MGVRSTVVIAIDKEALLKQIALSNQLPKLLSDEGNFENKVSEEFIVYWHFSGIKWYDTYPEVADVIAFLDLFADDAFGLLELVETGEVEEMGNPGDFDIFTETFISSPIGDLY